MSLQLSFSLRLSSGVKSVHLVGSWDNYDNQLPLSKDKSSSKSGSWKGTFRFHQGTLEPGERYWYYYSVDGYHCVHNPSVDSVVEPTTGRELNILDIPEGKSHKSSSSSSKHHSSSKSSSKHHSSSSSSSKDKERERRKKHSSTLSIDIPKGRPLSTSQIKAPQPVSPHVAKALLQAEYDDDTIDDLAARFGHAMLDEEDGIITDFHGGSPASSATGSSGLSYRSDSSSPSNGSGYSTPHSDYGPCTCERFGITRKGERIKLDCGGAVCGYENGSDCSSGSDDDRGHYDRRGVVVR